MEQLTEQDWNRPGIRAEFEGDKEVFEAYLKAEERGLVKRMKPSKGLRKTHGPLPEPGVELRAAPLHIVGSVGMSGARSVLRSAAAAALKAIRTKAVELQDSRDIPFGDALELAEKELSAETEILDRWEAETGELIPVRAR